MGKKKHSKNKKSKSRYNKKQFVDIYCHNCGLCTNYPPDPMFCYEELYKTSPDKFLGSCFVGLLRMKREIENSGYSGKDITMSQFHDIFCISFCEKESCEFIADCFRSFKSQINGRVKSKISIRKDRKKKKNKKNKKNQYICQPYPTIFTSDNKAWQIKIENILSDGNNNRKQNKIEESAG